MNTLFGKEENKDADEEAAEGAYETVNEQATTDTASAASDGEAASRSSANESQQTEKAEAGIQSSDEEDAVERATTGVAQGEEPKQNTVDSFDNEALFLSQGKRDKLEHKYGFGEVDLEEYAAKIEAQADTQIGSQQDKSEEFVANQ